MLHVFSTDRLLARKPMAIVNWGQREYVWKHMQHPDRTLTTCNMKTLTVIEDWNRWNILEHVVASSVWKHMQHPDQKDCNIRLEINETFWTNACNMPLKHLQHMQHVQYLLIYFCNIHMKQLQHTSETPKTLETYICNIGERKAVRLVPVVGSVTP
jgi:hypothetical protein